jgi:hypothetical protein
MISKQELRGEARKRKLSLDLIEKDYVLGWVLCAISLSGFSSKIAFNFCEREFHFRKRGDESERNAYRI